MSLHEYKCSQSIELLDPPFYAMMMALMRKADSDNLAKLKTHWPEVWDELHRRYHAPGGILPEDGVESLGDQVVEVSGEVRWVCAACGGRVSMTHDSCFKCDTARGCG